MTGETRSPIQPEFVNAADAARLLSVSRWTLYALAAKGHLASYALPGSRAIRFKIEDVRALLRERTQRIA